MKQSVSHRAWSWLGNSAITRTGFFVALVFVIFKTVGLASVAPDPDDVKPLAPQKATLSISARIYFGDEDDGQVDLAEADFYLLDKNVVEILRTADFAPVGENGDQLKDENSYLEALANAFAEPGEENELLALLIQDAVGKKQLATVKTNPFGFGKSKIVNAGNRVKSKEN